MIELDAVELTIDKVTVGGKPATFRHDGKKLRVELPADRGRRRARGRDRLPGRAAPRPVLHRRPTTAIRDKPLQAWTQGQDEDSRYWFPCFDAPNEKATSEIKVTVPANLFALSNGVLRRRDKTRAASARCTGGSMFRTAAT